MKKYLALQPLQSLVAKLYGVVLIVCTLAVGYCVVVALQARQALPFGVEPTRVSQRRSALELQAMQINDQGNSYIQQKQWKEAEATFRRALKVNGGWTAASLNLYGLAQALDKQGCTWEAYYTYRSLYPAEAAYSTHTLLDADPEALANYALVCDQIGHWSEAVQVYEKALQYSKVVPGLPALNVHFTSTTRRSSQLRAMLNVVRGIALDEQDKYQDALAAYAEAVRLQPRQAVAQYYLGYGLQKAGRFAEAKAAFAKAAQFGQGDVKAAAEEALKRQQQPR